MCPAVVSGEDRVDEDGHDPRGLPETQRPRAPCLARSSARSGEAPSAVVLADVSRSAQAQEVNAAAPLIGEGEGCGVLSQNGCRYNSFCYYSYHYSILYCSLVVIMMLLLLMILIS